MTVIGLIDGNDVLGILPVNAADNLLHVALSALGLIAGVASRDEPQRGSSQRSALAYDDGGGGRLPNRDDSDDLEPGQPEDELDSDGEQRTGVASRPSLDLEAR